MLGRVAGELRLSFWKAPREGVWVQIPSGKTRAGAEIFLSASRGQHSPILSPVCTPFKPTSVNCTPCFKPTVF